MNAIRTVVLLCGLCQQINHNQLCQTKLLEIMARIFHHDDEPSQLDAIGSMDWQSVIVMILSQRQDAEMT
jgi:hypothetical protein